MIKRKASDFWIAQAIGWAIFSFTNITVQSLVGTPMELAGINTLFATSTGILVTTLYHYSIKQVAWQKWSLGWLLVYIGGSSLALAVIWLLATALLFKLCAPQYHISFNEILANLVNGGLLFLIWNLIYFFFKYFMKYREAEIEKWKLAAEMKEAQLGTLRAQIKPHFVFNALNNIKALILEDKEKAREMLMNFSELFRYSLLHADKKEVPVEEELLVIKQFLELLSIQYEDRLNYSIEVAPGLMDKKIPPMALQLLVENAVKHGIGPNPKGGEVHIDLYQSEVGYFCVEVKNTGHLKVKEKLENHLGKGLKNIKERLHLLYGPRANFSLLEKPPYVSALITIPLEK